MKNLCSINWRSWGNKIRQILEIYFFFLCVRISSGKQVASVIVDDGKDQDDEDDTFVVEDPNAIQNDVDLVSSQQMVCLPLICRNFL